MQANRTPDRLSGVRPNAPLACGSVVGLGVTDVLQVTLRRVQLPSCVEELDELIRAHDAHAEHDDHAERQRYSAEVLRAMRSQVQGTATSGPPILYGPARTVSEVVAGALWDAVQVLAAKVEATTVAPADRRRALRHDAKVVAAWVRSYIDVQAVQLYSFDPEFDNHH